MTGLPEQTVAWPPGRGPHSGRKTRAGRTLRCGRRRRIHQ